MGFPIGARGKEPAYQCRRLKRHGFDPWVRKIPLEESRATHSSILACRTPRTEEPSELQSMGVAKSQTLKRLSMHALLHLKIV